MNIEELRTFGLQFAHVSEGFPFGERTLVFKVLGKIFLMLDLSSDPLQFNVKCDPERSLELRDQYAGSISPAYHMNKKHWNTIICSPLVSDRLIRSLIKESYALVVEKMPKKYREDIAHSVERSQLSKLRTSNTWSGGSSK